MHIGKQGVLVLILSIVSCGPNMAQTEVNRVNPFSAFNYILNTDLIDKKAILQEIDEGKRVPLNTAFSKRYPLKDYLLLDGEAGVYALEVRNKDDKNATYLVSTNLPQQWEVKMRRQALLTDFYTHQQTNNPKIAFYGDALPKLILQPNGKWEITIRPKEVVRIFVEFTANKASLKGTNKLEIMVSNINKEAITQTIPITVAGKRIPDVNFTSVVFNNNTYQIASFADDLIKVGFTHLISYTPPTLTFDRKGNSIGTINQATQNSKEFRYVTNYWVKKGMPILLYWTAHFGKLAPVKDGTFLEPYSKEWIKAYVTLVKTAFEDIKKRVPNLKHEQIVLYVQDEISSGVYSNTPSANVVDAQLLLKAIKQELPAFKTFLTLGFYSYPADLKLVLPYTDIAMPHIFMPEQLKRNAPKSYNPAEAFKNNLYSNYKDINLERIKKLRAGQSEDSHSGSGKLWSYLVTEGKTTNILNFRALPVYATFLGREGLSWWAFYSTKGSSWLPNDKNALDYSMIYNRELDNPVYKSWNKDTNEAIVPSIRLYASRAGIQDAKLLKFITENMFRLSGAHRRTFNDIIDKLSKGIDETGTQPSESNYLDVNEYEDISQNLRRIYISL